MNLWISDIWTVELRNKCKGNLHCKDSLKFISWQVLIHVFIISIRGQFNVSLIKLWQKWFASLANVLRLKNKVTLVKVLLNWPQFLWLVQRDQSNMCFLCYAQINFWHIKAFCFVHKPVTGTILSSQKENITPLSSHETQHKQVEYDCPVVDSKAVTKGWEVGIPPGY